MKKNISEEIVFNVEFYDVDSMRIVWHGNYVKYMEASRCALLNKIGYNYNRLTHRFRFTGELPKGTCIFQVYVTIDDCDLYQDELFYRYCRAAAMQNMGRIIGTFTYNLPGGVTINADMYTQEGQDALDAIKEEMKELSAPDFFLTS